MKLDRDDDNWENDTGAGEMILGERMMPEMV